MMICLHAHVTSIRDAPGGKGGRNHHPMDRVESINLDPYAFAND